MRTLILWCVFICSSVFSFGQTINDSISIAHTDTITDNIKDDVEPVGRYKLYPTHNTYNFLRLDTATGLIWTVQWNTSYKNRFASYVNEKRLDLFSEQERIGRFELQKTENIWTFLLIDTIEGSVWQVQWGLDKKDNMILKIIEYW